MNEGTFGSTEQSLLYKYCVCVCVFFPFIQEGHTGFLIHLPPAVRALIFLVRKIQPFLSLIDREVEFCVILITI